MAKYQERLNRTEHTLSSNRNKKIEGEIRLGLEQGELSNSFCSLLPPIYNMDGIFKFKEK